MQCACTLLSSVACPALQYYSTFSHKWHDLRKKGIDYKMCFDFPCNYHLKILFTLSSTERDMIKMYIALRVKYTLFVKFEWNLNFLARFSKICHENPSSRCRAFPYGRLNGQADRDMKLIVAFLNFANAVSNVYINFFNDRPLRKENVGNRDWQGRF